MDNICNATIRSNSSDGQCKCRKNIEGRDCRQPVSGYFVPKMDYFLVEAEYTHGRVSVYSFMIMLELLHKFKN